MCFTSIGLERTVWMAAGENGPEPPSPQPPPPLALCIHAVERVMYFKTGKARGCSSASSRTLAWLGEPWKDDNLTPLSSSVHSSHSSMFLQMKAGVSGPSDQHTRTLWWQQRCWWWREHLEHHPRGSAFPERSIPQHRAAPWCLTDMVRGSSPLVQRHFGGAFQDDFLG